MGARLRGGRSGIWMPQGQEILSSPERQEGSGYHPAPSFGSWWRVASFQGVKRLGSESDGSPTRSAEIRINGVVLPRPIYL